MGLWNLFKRKDSRAAGIIHAPTYGGAIWPERRYDIFAREAYMKNIIAFRAISEIAMGVATPPWNVNRRLKDGTSEDVSEHWAVDLIKRPNSKESWTRVMLKLAAFYNLDGNVFSERVCPTSTINAGKGVLPRYTRLERSSRIPKEIYIHRPDRIQMLVDNSTNTLVGYAKETGPVKKRGLPTTGIARKIPVYGKGMKSSTIIGYRYTVGGRSVDWEIDPVTKQCDLYHMKAFHPLSDFWGASPTESMSREIDTSNEAIEWQKKTLQNEGRPGLIMTIVADLGDKEFEEYERALKTKHGGADNAGKDLVLVGERGTKAEPYAWSPKEMDFLESNREWARRIALGYGVPPMLLGIPGDNTYSNQKEARLALWEGTILYHLRYFRGELNNWLFIPDGPDSDIYLDFDMGDIPALEPRHDAKWDRAEKSTFLSINEKRKMVGLEDWGEAGNVILVPATQVPLGIDKEEEEEAEEEENEKAIERLMEEQGVDREEAIKLLGLDMGDEEE